MNLYHKAAFGLYNICWRIARPWLKLNQRLADGYDQRTMKDCFPERADLWIQAASVGESFLALEILQRLQTARPIKIQLTSNTRQGVDILSQALPELNRRNHQMQTAVRYFPFDQPSMMAKAVAGIRPKVTVLLETEIWPGLLRALKMQRCKTIIVNGRITAKSLKWYHLWPSIWQTLRPDRILAISAADADRFGRLFGEDGVDIMPNIKFDRLAPAGSAEDDQNHMASLLPAGIPFIVFASVRQEEEPEVGRMLDEIGRRYPQGVAGIFPRHMQRLNYWQEALTRSGKSWVLRSAVSNPVPPGTVIVWDAFGELMPAYRRAQAAFVGGSLAPLGGQNFLEAIVSGLVPVSGPSWENFAWVGRKIIEAGLLRVAEDWRQAAAQIKQDLDASQPRAAVIEKAQRFFEPRRGGTDQACRVIEEMLFEEG